MTDMIEKLARSICESVADDPDKVSQDMATLDKFGPDAKRWQEWIPEAIAALEALRTPTNEMIEAGVNRGRRDDLYTDVEHCFQVMADKALGRVDLPVEEQQQP